MKSDSMLAWYFVIMMAEITAETIIGIARFLITNKKARKRLVGFLLRKPTVKKKTKILKLIKSEAG